MTDPMSERLTAEVEAACEKALLLTQDVMGVRSQHWRGQDYADGLDAGIEVAVGLVRDALAARAQADPAPDCRYPCGCDQFADEHCTCMDGHAAHPAPAETREVKAEACCPGAGSMAHVRGCRNHPEAAR